MTRVPQRIVVSDTIAVRRYVREDAEALVDAVTASLGHLRPWMAWISHEPQSVEQRRALISEWSAAWDAGTDFVMGIFDEGVCIGSTGLHLRGAEGTIEIGYWLAPHRLGRGIITSVVNVLFDTACSLPEISAVEIVTDVANTASSAVAERCGFSVSEEFRHQPEAPSESGMRLRWEKRCSC